MSLTGILKDAVRQSMSTHDRPTSDWEHSHALEEGDELVTTFDPTPVTVLEVYDDGSVDVRCWHDERYGEEYVDDHWSEEHTTSGLANNDIETTDGKSRILAAL